MALIDPHGRRINYLRLSVTDRCNLRCRYCMPAAGVPKLAHDDLLRYEDLARIAGEAVAAGIEKIRITGGEPLVRKGVVDFCARLARITGLRELVLTTNGIGLPELARPLRKAGVERLNVSLDSLRVATFAAITRGGDLSRVLAGLDAAREAGFPPAKINMVVMRGINDDEILDFAARTLTRGETVRFIEYMPNLKEKGWENRWMAGGEILDRIGRHFRLLPHVGTEMAGPSRNFRISGGEGTIGIITPVSGHFCDSCNRIRVSATGVARGCLFAGAGIDLKPYLAADPEALRRVLREIVAGKPARHHLTEDDPHRAAFAMSGIGG